jgi:hypothetical protein
MREPGSRDQYARQESQHLALNPRGYLERLPA